MLCLRSAHLKTKRKTGSLIKTYVFLSVAWSSELASHCTLRGHRNLRVQACLVSEHAFWPLKQKNLMPQKWAATFWSCTCSIFSCARHDMLCQATVFKLPLIYFIFISDKGQVIWILIVQGDLYVRCRTPRRALWYSYCSELTCFAYKSWGGLLCPALLGALVEIKMWGVQATFMPLYFPFLLLSFQFPSSLTAYLYFCQVPREQKSCSLYCYYF